MKGVKKINLLPPAYKSKYLQHYCMMALSVVCGIFVIGLLFQAGYAGILSHQIKMIQSENEKYTREKDKIAGLQESVARQKNFIQQYETGYFPFVRFMQDMETFRPDDVYIISVDTQDRLIHEGEDFDRDETKDKTVPEDEQKGSQKEKGNADEKDTDTEENEPAVAYIGDLTGQTLTIRGYGGRQRDISTFIYSLSHLPYIQNAKITAIEEHEMTNGLFNIFEIKVTGGTAY